MRRMAMLYREFWHVPRMFAVEPQPGLALIFDCPIDETTDDYVDFFNVWSVEAQLSDALRRYLSLDTSPGPAYVGMVDVGDVEFDVTRRKSVSSGVLDKITARR